MPRWFPTFHRLLHTRIALPDWLPRWPLYTTASQQFSLLRLLATASEEGVPLVPLLEAWAADEWGVQRVRVHRLAALIQKGTSLPDALEAVPGVLNDEAVLAIRFDAQMGTRTAAVREMLNKPESSHPTTVSRISRALWYLATVGCVAAVIMLFLQLKIMPVMIKMFYEFDMEMNPLILECQNLLRSFGSYWFVILFGLVVVYFLFVSRAGKVFRRNLGGRFLRTEKETNAADLMGKLAIAMEAGRPLPGALTTLARYHFDPTLRNKLLFVRNELELGTDLWESLRNVGVLSDTDLRVVRTAERVGNRSWALRLLAQGLQSQSAHRTAWAQEFVLPAVVVLMGCLVLVQSVSIFWPLVQLIQSLA